METILEQKLDKEHDSRVYTSHQLESMTDISLVEGGGGGGEEPKYPVTLQIRNLKSNRLLTVRTKYVIGADGGKSTVRKLSGIPFEGNRTGAKWVRMDVSFLHVSCIRTRPCTDKFHTGSNRDRHAQRPFTQLDPVPHPRPHSILPHRRQPDPNRVHFFRQAPAKMGLGRVGRDHGSTG